MGEEAPEEAPLWAVKYGGCISCGIGTRSHVLEPPEYESYEQEVIVEQSDDFASKKWEEVDTVTKWAISDEPLANMQRIKSFLSKWVKFEFEEVVPADEEMNMLVKNMRESIRRAARGE